MKIQLFKDILKTKVENGLKYSQGRVYLFVFVVAYVACLAYYMFAPVVTTMQTIIDSIQWAILLFAAYVFGTSGVTATKDIFKIKNGVPTSDSQPKQTDAPVDQSQANTPAA